MEGALEDYSMQPAVLYRTGAAVGLYLRWLSCSRAVMAWQPVSEHLSLLLHSVVL